MDRSGRAVRVLTGTLIAVVFAVVAGGLSVAVVGAFGGPILIGLGVAAGMSAAVGLAPWRPGLALLVGWVAAVAQMLAVLPVIPADLAVLVVLFAAGAAESRRLRYLGLASAIGGALVAVGYLTLPSFVEGPRPATSVAVLLLGGALVILVLSWTFGLLLATLRRARRARAEAAAAARETIAEQERGRIARDMHDVVAHSLAVIIAQADGARYLGTSDPERSAATLTTISQVARAALGDVRLLLERLRYRQGDLPQPSVVEIEALVAQVREAGLDVELSAGPVPESVPHGAQLAAYRIVQESLTNALRHGDRVRPARVRIEWSPRSVGLEVRSAMRAGVTPGDPGHGLLGIRERARLAGGSASAGPDGDEFVVSAEIPFEPREGVA